MMRSRVETVPREAEVKPEEYRDESECRHYWLIDSANGPTSRGICKFCGEEKDFYNSVPEFTLYKRAEKKTGQSDPSDQPRNNGRGGE